MVCGSLRKNHGKGMSHSREKLNRTSYLYGKGAEMEKNGDSDDRLTDALVGIEEYDNKEDVVGSVCVSVDAN